MLYSMTGYGRAEGSLGPDRQVSVDVKSLNGKQLDLATRISPMLRPYELDLRSMLASMLVRGSLDVSISIRQEGAQKPMVVNEALARQYYQGMQQIAHSLGIGLEQALPTLMRMPDVVAADTEVLSESQWLEVKALTARAAMHLTEHRREEGAMLEGELTARINEIESLLEAVAPLEEARTRRMKAKLGTAFTNAGLEADANRFEQELIYYLEKLDVSEEKVRLAQHCQYFRETLEKSEAAKGKTLGFILQEIGREINTLGSKANDAAIQKLVIQMKDALEKAREQVLNVL